MQGLRHETGPASFSANAARPSQKSGWPRIREVLSEFDDGVKNFVRKLVRRGEAAAERGRRVPHMGAFVLASVSLLGFAVLVSPSVYRSVIPGGSVSAAEARQTFQPAPEPEVIHYHGDFERTTPDEESVKVTVDTVGAKPPSPFSTHWSSRPGLLLRYNLAGHGWPITFYGIYAAILLFFVFKQTAAKQWVWWVLFAVGLVSAYLFLEGIRLLFFVLCFAVPYDLIRRWRRRCFR